MQSNSPFSPRLAIFLVIAAVIMIGWQFTPWGKPVPRPQPAPVTATAAVGAQDAATAAAQAEVAAAAAVSAAPLVGAVLEDASERSETLVFGQPGEPGYLRAVFTNRGAQLLDLRLGGYFKAGQLDPEQQSDPEYWTRVLVPELPSQPTAVAGGSLALSTSASSLDLVRKPLAEALWTMEVQRDAAGAPLAVVFRYAPGTGVEFEKIVRKVPGSYQLEVELALRNVNAGSGGPRIFQFTPAAWMPEALGDKFYVEPQVVVVAQAEGELPELHSGTPDTGTTETGTLPIGGRLLYAGVHNKYFAVLLRPLDAVSADALDSLRFERANVPDPHADPTRPTSRQYLKPLLDLELPLPNEGREERRKYALWVGPKQRALFEDSAHPELQPFVQVLDHDLGWFAGIARLLTATLELFHRLAGNWGVAVILLTVAVRIVLFPLNRRSQTAMARHAKKMKRVQPKMDELKKKHEKDPTKLREAQAKLMQEEGLFPPLGGCLPVFLQMPIFFGLFAALRASFDLRQAPFFGWIHDLSLPDQMVEINVHIPVIFTTLDIRYFNLLPILMVALWLGQQMTAPKPTDEQALKMQRMMMFMPVLMGLFLYDYAAGLSLYMITSSTFAILEQTVVKKIWPIDDTIQEKKPSGCAPFTKLMQRAMEQQKQQQQRTPARKK
jgi:YidC/Oxa1 family membrane protein insertase